MPKCPSLPNSLLSDTKEESWVIDGRWSGGGVVMSLSFSEIKGELVG
jgi:hypothetical protein